MKIFILIGAALISCASALQANNVRGPGISVDIGGPYGYYYYYDNPAYQAWAGPGWYYGIYFNNPDSYFYWLNNGFYDVYWVGPGYYYGVYFNSEPYFNDYRRYHRFYGRGNVHGHGSYHKKKNRGKWNSKGHQKSVKQ